MDFQEKTVNKNYVYQGKILSLRVDDALRADGKPCKREIIEHSGGACVLYVENDQILFVKQYRYAYGEMLLEIPAGKLNAGEDPMLAAKRELEEETGVKSENLQLLYVMYPTPGYTNERIYIYLAKDGERVPAHLDDGEFLQVEWIKIDKVKAMLRSGEIRDGKTLIALQAYFLGIEK